MEAEKVTFITPERRKLLHIKPEKKVFRGEILEIMPAKLIAFDMGQYVTSDAEEIRKIRESKAYERREIKEITENDKDAVNLAVQQQRVIRGTITAQSLAQEAGIEEKKEPVSLKEATTQCPECGKIFTNDLHKRKVGMHMRRMHSLKNKE